MTFGRSVRRYKRDITHRLYNPNSLLNGSVTGPGTLKTSILVKRFLSNLAQRLGLITRRLNRLGENGFLILMYHRILPPEKIQDWLEPGMYVHTETFEMHIQYLKQYFEILSLKRLISGENINRPGGRKKAYCAITFDDGWLDTHQYAVPILERYRVPATVFLPTDFIDTENWFWTDKFLYLMSQMRLYGKSTGATRIKLNNGTGNRLSITPDDRQKVEMAIHLLKTKKQPVINDFLEDIQIKWRLETDLPGRAFMNWKEIQELVSNGLISFGSHTAQHNILTTLTPEEIKLELIRSKNMLLEKRCVDKAFIPFCYPNGGFTAQIASDVREAGYDYAVTTKKGWNKMRSDFFIQNRVGIHQDITSTTATFGARIACLF